MRFGSIYRGVGGLFTGGKNPFLSYLIGLGPIKGARKPSLGALGPHHGRLKPFSGTSQVHLCRGFKCIQGGQKPIFDLSKPRDHSGYSGSPILGGQRHILGLLCPELVECLAIWRF